MTAPLISVVIPAHNEAGHIRATLASIAASRSRRHTVEFIVVDDASTDGGCDDLVPAARDVPIRVVREKSQVGVARARNRGALEAAGSYLFMTDGHVRLPRNWDLLVVRHIKRKRILAAAISDRATAAKAFGCSLVVPYMGTRWNFGPSRIARVQIASSAGTVVARETFEAIGGYDPGMILYAGAEPEFSVRAWLSGVEIVAVPVLEVAHRFKPKRHRKRFLDEVRPFIIHNNLRFGFLYLSEAMSLQMIRHFAMEFPDHAQQAFGLIASSDVWRRRTALRRRLVHDFPWFVRKFDLKDQAGRPIL